MCIGIQADNLRRSYTLLLQYINMNSPYKLEKKKQKEANGILVPIDFQFVIVMSFQI